MSTYEYQIISINPEEVQAGNQVSCAADGFEMHSAGSALFFGGGNITSTETGNSYQLNGGNFFDLQGGFFAITIPADADSGNYSIAAYFWSQDNKDVYSFESDFEILKVTKGSSDDIQFTTLQPRFVTEDEVRQKTYTVTGKNVNKATNIHFARILGDGAPQLMLNIAEQEEQFAKFRVITAQSRIKTGMYRLQGENEVTGTSVVCPQYFVIKEPS